mmetsp:Transcript_2680/g.7376  ORF Transcript_2680/g.7376 Transcript_2680/m.7376 type:complete len:143 (+) Transcript_2680:190-618(+)
MAEAEARHRLAARAAVTATYAAAATKQAAASATHVDVSVREPGLVMRKALVDTSELVAALAAETEAMEDGSAMAVLLAMEMLGAGAVTKAAGPVVGKEAGVGLATEAVVVQLPLSLPLLTATRRSDEAMSHLIECPSSHWPP